MMNLLHNHDSRLTLNGTAGGMEKIALEEGKLFAEKLKKTY